MKSEKRALARQSNGKVRPKRYLGLLCAFIALAALLGCSLPFNTGNQYTGPSVIEKAQIVFTVKPLKPPGEGDSLELVIVDEVTGIPYHQERLAMDPMQDGLYGTVYQTPVGSLLTYVFNKVKADGSRISEVGVDWQPIRYRMYHAAKPGVSQETIAGWEDDLPNREQAGHISGTVEHAELGEPLADILVTAGGMQAVTDAQGHFVLHPLPPGSQNLVSTSMTGLYQPAQDKAEVAPGKVTPAGIKMDPSAFREVTFNVQVPGDTVEGAPIRMAGNLAQLGNTFTELGGGMSGDTRQMPLLSPLKDGWFTTTMILPAGIDIRYKFTLGDGFWNAEHAEDLGFVTRQLIIPAEADEVLLEDRVATWRSNSSETVWFQATVPSFTPSEEPIGIQFSIVEWMPALPMFKIKENTWAYPLISPHNFSGEIPYRYCRNTPCTDPNHAGAEYFTEARTTATNLSQIQLNTDTISEWTYLGPPVAPALTFTDLPQGDRDLIAGVGLSPLYKPNQQSHITQIVTSSQSGYNHVIISPGWVTAPQPGPQLFRVSLTHTSRWQELAGEVKTAHLQGLQVSLFPQLIFPDDPVKWWDSLPTGEENTWQRWLTEYQEMIYQYAAFAEKNEVESFVLGGEWLDPALPVGDNFNRYSQPGNIESLWDETIRGIRERYSGQIGWVLTSASAEDPPEFLHNVDMLFLQWDQPIEAASSQRERIEITGEALDNLAEPLTNELKKPLVLVIIVPSVLGYGSDCIPSPHDAGDCVDLSVLKLGPSIENPAASDIQLQAAYYHAVLTAVADRPWIDGVISQGYYPPLALHDSSASIHGKPAETLFQNWLALVLGN